MTAPAPPVAAAAAAGHEVAAEGRVVDLPRRGGAASPPSAAAGWSRLVVEEGDRVRAGELLAEIESDELRAALAEARAA